MATETFVCSEWNEIKEFVEVKKFEPKVFQNDPEDTKLDFVRIYHDFTWQIGVVIKGLKSKKCYEIILLDYMNDDKDDSFWKLHELDKKDFSRSYALGQELISKIRTYMRKEDTGKWLVTCKFNAPSRVKSIGYVSMTVNGGSVPVKLEQLNIY